jgi:hypothetical protein
MKKQRLCRLRGCDGKHNARGYCKTHYYKLRKYGDPKAVGPGKGGSRTSSKWAGVHITNNGYRRLRTERGWLLEHRYVMENFLGRSLMRGESVHHRDGDRLNNELSNLELWVRPQPNGVRARDALAWAHEVIDRYEGIRDAIVL